MNLEIGLVGVGPWGANILRDLRSLGAVVHCCARSDGSSDRARVGGAASIVEHPDKLPESCAGFVVATRTTSHLDAIRALLPRGRPIFCEKPLSNDLGAARALPAEAHRLVFVMHKWRYHPGIIELARIAATQSAGPVEGLRLLRLGWGNHHTDVSSLWVLAPHDISIAHAVLGETPRPVAAMRDVLGADADGAVAMLETRAGAGVTIEASSGHPSNLRRITLRCRDATFELDSADYATITSRSHSSGEVSHIRVGDEMPLLTELRAFLAHVRGGPPPHTALAEEIRMIEAITEIERMAARR
ncbi:Gfo/Idh/MocA family protein [Terricaulis silvestris]|uniref:NAD-binding Rossmann fold oxidoreductase n=1 Tax=Terricaulis silvestris TaxID=2686094 RepID=A0A6I6MNT9_9CAUL|nr:Gfo/Idh/MocA family oxidoreductase [Terricaulis silvestris]QGZ95791.1 NAD-binding Rossmann fold oxidoreductase [Terricaulis silvestris]